jgi:MFS family permease
MNGGEIAQGAIDQPDEETAPSGGRMRSLVAFMVLSVFTQAVLFSSISFIPLYMVDNFSVTEGVAAVFLATIYSAGLWASPLGGYLSDRFGTVRVVLVMSFLTGPALYLLTVMPFGPSGIAIGALLLFTGAILYIRMPAAEAFIVHNSSERRRSTILGIYYFSNMEVGAIFAPLMGFLIDKFDFATSFTMAGATAFVVSIGCWMFLKGNRD